MKSHSDRYREAGVDITAGYEAVRRIGAHVARTATDGVLSGLGGFGGLFMPDLSGISQPVLVSGTDGVGTKLKIAFAMNRHDTIGIDCVAMCVNDILCSGARPLFFLDYIACGRNRPDAIESIVSGIADGCVEAGCALIGGETAEMPGFYAADEYDLAGFAVGIVDRERMLDASAVSAGDVVLGLPSSGVHANGFSLVRRLFGDSPEAMAAEAPLLGMPLGEALLVPTRIYVRAVLALIDAVPVHGLCHITGGGFFENIPRCLPAGLAAKIETAAIPTPPIFDMIALAGDMQKRELYNTFNMGIGMVAVVARNDADSAVAVLSAAGEHPVVIGEVVPGDEGVILC